MLSLIVFVWAAQMLKRIRIKGYKSFEDLDLDLKPLSVLFGPNGSGKSNFLDALQLLSRLAAGRTLKDAFEPPYRGKPLESFTFGRRGIKGLRSEKELSFTIEIDVELSTSVIDEIEKEISEMRRTSLRDEVDAVNNANKTSFIKEINLRYRIEIQIKPESGFLQVSDEYLAALTSKGALKKTRTPFLERKQNKLHLRMEKRSHPTFYDRYLDHSILSRPLYPPHYPHMAAMRRELESWFFFYFEPRERMRAPNPVKEVRHIGLMGEELAAFLNTLKVSDEKRFRAVEKALQTIIPSATGIDVQVNDFGEVELNLLEGETPVPARIISEGTLRIIGLLSLMGAKEIPSVIGFEEPENGVHPNRVRFVAALLQNMAAEHQTQMIVTTHSPLLTDLIPLEHLFVCKKEGAKTLIKPFDTIGGLFKKSEIEDGLSEEEDLSVSDRILRGDFDV